MNIASRMARDALNRDATLNRSGGAVNEPIESVKKRSTGFLNSDKGAQDPRSLFGMAPMGSWGRKMNRPLQGPYARETESLSRIYRGV